MDRTGRISTPERVWALTGLAVGLVMLLGSFIFPQRVYDGFIWQYFWGPVLADAHASACALRVDGTIEYLGSSQACADAAGIVATQGYTPLSTGVYTLVLLYAIVGIVFLVERLNIEWDRGLFFAVVPYVFFGGALRVIEDANATLYVETGEMLLAVPWVGLIISPPIYAVVFVIVAFALLLSRDLAARGLVERYEFVFASIGIALLAGTLAILGSLVLVTDVLTVHAAIPIITLGGATVITAVVWWATERYYPTINAGTGLMGAVVIWGHAVDGVANVLSLDWWWAVGLSSGYAPKHVVNRAIIDVTGSIQPASLTDAIGTAWPFLPLKVLVAVIVVWVFDETLFEENPTFGLLLLIAVLAVGLGPGTRDFLRATLGI